MIAQCCICEEEIELDIDEFIKVQDDIEEYFCIACAERAREYIREEQLRKN